MRHSRIAVAAAHAAAAAANQVADEPVDLTYPPISPRHPDGLHELYAYTRARKFPPPETLARKHAELTGSRFPYASISDAREETRVAFTVFRAVAEALEPFHEPDPEKEDDDAEGEAEAAVQRGAQAGGAIPGDEGTQPAGEAPVRQVPEGQAGQVEDPAGAPGGATPAAEIPDDAQRPGKAEEKDVTEDTKTADTEVDAKTKAAQAETDKVIAESGGKFSEKADADEAKKKGK